MGGFIIKLNACTYVWSQIFSVALGLKIDLLYEERAHPSLSLSVDTVLLNEREYSINRGQLHLKET